MWNLKGNDTNKLTNKIETNSQTLKKSLWLGGGYGIAYLRNLKGNDTDKLTNKTETDSQTLRKSLWLRGGKMVGRDSYGVCDGHVHTAIFKMDNL